MEDSSVKPTTLENVNNFVTELNTLTSKYGVEISSDSSLKLCDAEGNMIIENIAFNEEIKKYDLIQVELQENKCCEQQRKKSKVNMIAYTFLISLVALGFFTAQIVNKVSSPLNTLYVQMSSERSLVESLFTSDKQKLNYVLNKSILDYSELQRKHFSIPYDFSRSY